MDDILEKVGLSYDDLSKEEKETLEGWRKALEQNKLTVSGIREYISSMKEQVETDLTKTGTDTKQDIFLKARLRNYMLLEAYLTSPEKAKVAIDRALSGMIAKT